MMYSTRCTTLWQISLTNIVLTLKTGNLSKSPTARCGFRANKHNQYRLVVRLNVASCTSTCYIYCDSNSCFTLSFVRSTVVYVLLGKLCFSHKSTAWLSVTFHLTCVYCNCYGCVCCYLLPSAGSSIGCCSNPLDNNHVCSAVIRVTSLNTVSDCNEHIKYLWFQISDPNCRQGSGGGLTPRISFCSKNQTKQSLQPIAKSSLWLCQILTWPWDLVCGSIKSFTLQRKQ